MRLRSSGEFDSTDPATFKDGGEIHPAVLPREITGRLPLPLEGRDTAGPRRPYAALPPEGGNRLLSVFLEAGGRAVLQTGLRVVTKKWYFKRGMLCRTVGRDNRKHGAKVPRGSKPGTLIFSNAKAGFKYEGTVLEGRKLSD